MELTECEQKGFIRKVTPNSGIITSVKEMAQIKYEEASNKKLNERNISVYFSMYYDAIRELLEVYCLKEGFKVLNHVCLGEKMKELEPEFNFTVFDRIRYLRNGINYYGKRVPLEQGELLIPKMKDMYNWIIKRI